MGKNLIVFTISSTKLPSNMAGRIVSRSFTTLPALGARRNCLRRLRRARRRHCLTRRLLARRGPLPSEQPTFSCPFLPTVNPRPQQRPPRPSQSRRPSAGRHHTRRTPQNPLNLSFADQITLLGFDLNPKSKIVNLKLYWRANTPPPPTTPFHPPARPAWEPGCPIRQPSCRRRLPTSLWTPAKSSRRASAAKPAPGRYTVQIGLYRPDTSQRLAVVGSPDGAVKLAEIEVGE